jgi:hypothetical protein
VLIAFRLKNEAGCVCFIDDPSALKNYIRRVFSEIALAYLEATASSASLSKRAAFTKEMSLEHPCNSTRSANSEANRFSVIVKKFCAFYEF